MSDTKLTVEIRVTDAITDKAEVIAAIAGYFEKGYPKITQRVTLGTLR